MGILTYNGKTSKDLFQVERPPDYKFPEKDYDIIHVPGRNGDIIIDKGTYKNVLRDYDIAVGSLTKSFTEQVNKISEWLHSSPGYARLEDTYEPDYYRLALYVDDGNFENILDKAGRTTILFNCKPQRFLKTGDIAKDFSSTGMLINPTNFVALPIITISGSGDGVLRIGDYMVTITGIQNGMVLNSEIEESYNGTINLNDTINLQKGFPKLSPGNTEISFSGGITAISVIPKWWTL